MWLQFILTATSLFFPPIRTRKAKIVTFDSKLSRTANNHNYQWQESHPSYIVSMYGKLIFIFNVRVIACVFPAVVCMYFQGGSMVKNLPAKAGDMGLIPGLGEYPGEDNGNPLQYSCLGNSMDRTSLRVFSGCVCHKRVRHNLETKQQLLIIISVSFYMLAYFYII